MTREEAIKGLKVLAKDFSGYRPNEEMFNMAITALEQPDLKNKIIDILDALTIDAKICPEWKVIDALRYIKQRVRDLK